MFIPQVFLLLLLFFFTFSECIVNSDAASAAASSLPLPFNERPLSSSQESTKDATNLSEGIFTIAKTFNSTFPVGKCIKPLMTLSQKIGLILMNGYPWVANNDDGTTQKFHEACEEFLNVTSNMISHLSDSLEKVANRQSISQLQRAIQPTFNLLDSFRVMLQELNGEAIATLKSDCKRNHMDLVLDGLINDQDTTQAIIKDNYSDFMYENLYQIRQLVLKQAIVMYTFCNNFLNGKADPEVRKHNHKKVLQAVLENYYVFLKMKKQQRKMFWNSIMISSIIKQNVLNVTNSFQRKKTDQNENQNIANAIFNVLTENFNSLGYDFHVSVSNATQKGYIDSLIMCATECQYLYNFLGKDIYVIRAKKAEKYQTCDYLAQMVTSNSLASDSGNLVPFTTGITSQCEVAAISVIRDGFDYRSANANNYDKSKALRRMAFVKNANGFVENYFNGVAVVVAYYPL